MCCFDCCNYKTNAVFTWLFAFLQATSIRSFIELPSVKTSYPFFWYADVTVLFFCFLGFLFVQYMFIRLPQKRTRAQLVPAACIVMIFASFFLLFQTGMLMIKDMSTVITAERPHLGSPPPPPPQQQNYYH